MQATPLALRQPKCHPFYTLTNAPSAALFGACAERCPIFAPFLTDVCERRQSDVGIFFSVCSALWVGADSATNARMEREQSRRRTRQSALAVPGYVGLASALNYGHRCSRQRVYEKHGHNTDLHTNCNDCIRASMPSGIQSNLDLKKRDIRNYWI